MANLYRMGLPEKNSNSKPTRINNNALLSRLKDMGARSDKMGMQSQVMMIVEDINGVLGLLPL